MSDKNLDKLNVERGLISKLIETRDIETITTLDIDTRFFTGEHRRVFSYITKFVLENGEVPTPRVVKKNFPNYIIERYYNDDRGEKIYGTAEPLDYWCSEIRRKLKHNTLAEMIEKAGETLGEFDTEEAYKQIKKAISYVDSEVEITKSVDITDSTDKRKEVYEKKKLNHGIVGLETGIIPLDRILRGLPDETLTMIIATTGIGKAVTLDTPILTPEGFVPMRDIHTGAIVYDQYGKKTKVIAEFPQGYKDVFKVTFSDDSYVECCKDHLWKYKTKDDIVRGKDWRVNSLEYMMNNHSVLRGRTYNMCVPLCEPVEFDKKQLPIHPYVMGCLLGDGGFTTTRVTLSNPEVDIINKCSELLKEYGCFKYHEGTSCQYNFLSNNPRNNYLRRVIDTYFGRCKSEDKYIPVEYMQSSISDRLELLRGIVDTDGHINCKGAVSVSTKSVDLAKDVIQLAHSLGIRATYGSYTRDNGDTCEVVVRLCGDNDNVFSSVKHRQRYADRLIPKRKPVEGVLKIKSIEKLGVQKEMKCIAVDSESHTFICGDFIVTHNTFMQVLIGSYLALEGYKVQHFITEMSDNQMRDRYEMMLYSMTVGHISYKQFKEGKLPFKQEKSYYEFLDEILPDITPVILTPAKGVLAMRADIEKEKPDLVMIDGVYLMQDDQGAKDDWLRVAHITRDLKTACKDLHLPFLGNTQASQTTSKKTGPGLDSIMYTQAIGQDCDNIIAMWRDEVMYNEKEMGVKVLKQREGEQGQFIMTWDFDTMTFKPIYSVDQDGNSNPEEDEDAEDALLD